MVGGEKLRGVGVLQLDEPLRGSEQSLIQVIDRS
jgi:hypothetical protein